LPNISNTLKLLKNLVPSTNEVSFSCFKTIFLSYQKNPEHSVTNFPNSLYSPNFMGSWAMVKRLPPTQLGKLKPTRGVAASPVVTSPGEKN
jgi:hypothetical protein